MNTLPQSHYGDPLDVLLHEEEQTCKGCRYRKMIEGALQCTHPSTADPLKQIRCTAYEERE